MHVYLDFDDVLFNTKAFIEKLKGIFDAFGVSRELFERTYQEIKADSPGTGFCYSFERHIGRLRLWGTLDEDGLGRELKACMADTSKFLFSDVTDFLVSLKEEGYTMSVLSFGDVDFQQSKIRDTGISQYVEKNIITDTDKAEALRGEMMDADGEGWFFDDRVHFIESVKRAFPTIKTVLVRRSDGRFLDEPNEWCDYTVADLVEGGAVVIDSHTTSF